MAKNNASLGEFEPLFNKSVPHILENIFYSLDYESFMACRKVCKVLNKLLSTESYQQIAEKLLEEKMKNEEKLCESSASSKGDMEEIKHLLSIEVNPNCSKARGTKGTPLYYAALYGNKNVAQLLMKAGADPNKLNATGESPLLYAAYRSYPDLVKLLIENGADPKKAESAKIRTPLYWAVKDGSIDLTKLLLGAGAEVNSWSRSKYERFLEANSPIYG